VAENRNRRGDNVAAGRDASSSSGWVTTQQAARALRLSPRTVRWHIEQGNLEAKLQGEGVKTNWLVSVDSLHAFRDTRQAAAESPGGYRAAVEDAVIAAAGPGNPIRELADRLVEEAARASEFRVRLEISERAQSTLQEELAEERRRREEAERERDELRRRLEPPREAPVAPQTATAQPGRVEPQAALGGAQQGSERPERSWRERVRGLRRRFVG
jgi:Helix-turn-helix domain